MTLAILLVLIISFIAALVRSTLGFGESLIAVPLFLLLMPPDVAVPLSVMLSTLIALIIVIQDHSNIHFDSAKWLIFYAVFGVPLGLVILVYGNEQFIKIALGAILLLYAIYSLRGKQINIKNADSKLWLAGCGFVSGLLGGAYGLNGPPLVVYGNLRKWNAQYFRATLQAYSLPVSLISVLGYYSKGLITSEVTTYFGIALLTTIPAIFIGRALNRRLKGDSFYRYVYWGLMVISVILVITSIN